MGLNDLKRRGASAMAAAQARALGEHVAPADAAGSPPPAQEPAAAAQAAAVVSPGARTMPGVAGAGVGGVGGGVSAGTAVTRAITGPGAAAFYRPVIEEAAARADAAQRDLERAQLEVLDLSAKLAEQPGELELDQIEEAPGRRRRLSAQEYMELRENLASNVMVHPIVVRPTGRKLADGRRVYELISGGNRLAVFRDLGRARIAVRVLPLEDDAVQEASFWANLMQPALPEYERYLGLRAIRDSRGFGVRELARLSGLDAAVVSRLLTFEKLPPAVHEVLADNPRTLGAQPAAQLAAVCANPKNVDFVLSLVQRVCTGEITQEEAVSRARRGQAFDEAALAARSVKASTLQVRNGNVHYCKVVTLGKSVRLEFASDEWCAQAQAAIESLLREMASRAMKADEGDKAEGGARSAPPQPVARNRRR